ncbi:MAG: hypothetical protein U9R26_03780 [Campylobacterota bacterium]|nr:hypothetical protein [Campylobacterota bacterium]
MAKKKRKNFQKKQLLSLFEGGNYQKVISKMKQFYIDDMGEDEEHQILLTSYERLARDHFVQGDITRALREVNSLLRLEEKPEYKILKLKYLCYMEHFDDALDLGEELMGAGSKKLKTEALFWYLLASLYSGDYALEQKQLGALTKAKANYLLGLAALMQDDQEGALSYFEACKPRLKKEKENIAAILSIMKGEELTCDSSVVRPVYCFLMTGSVDNLPNTNSLRSVREDVVKHFAQIRKNIGIDDLLTLSTPVSEKLIQNMGADGEQKRRLIYNNIVLLANYSEHEKALKLFIKYRDSLVQQVESAQILIDLIKHAYDKKSSKMLMPFFVRYLKIHHQKLAPFQLDQIFAFLLLHVESLETTFNLAKTYKRDDFIFILKEISIMAEPTPYHVERFNHIMEKHTHTKEKLLELLLPEIENLAEGIDIISNKEELLYGRLMPILILVGSVDKPHKKYNKFIFTLLKYYAAILQGYNFLGYRKEYIILSDIIEKFIIYFNIERVKLPVDIKALYVSIDQERSVRISKDPHNESEQEIRLRILMGKDYESIQYDFDEGEYDLLQIEKLFVDAIKNGAENPFEMLAGLQRYKYDAYIIDRVLGYIVMLDDAGRSRQLYNIDTVLRYAGITLKDQHFRDLLVPSVRRFADKDTAIAVLFMEQALLNIPKANRTNAWYLNWIDGYLHLVGDYDLERGEFFNIMLAHFLETQRDKKYKSLNSKYKHIAGRFAETKIGGLFD